eukprot:810645-Alexandrium_andersonii.AAC.1
MSVCWSGTARALPCLGASAGYASRGRIIVCTSAGAVSFRRAMLRDCLLGALFAGRVCLLVLKSSEALSFWRACWLRIARARYFCAHQL